MFFYYVFHDLQPVNLYMVKAKPHRNVSMPSRAKSWPRHRYTRHWDWSPSAWASQNDRNAPQPMCFPFHCGGLGVRPCSPEVAFVSATVGNRLREGRKALLLRECNCNGLDDSWRRSSIGVCRGGISVSDLCRRSYIGVYWWRCPVRASHKSVK